MNSEKNVPCFCVSTCIVRDIYVLYMIYMFVCVVHT